MVHTGSGSLGLSANSLRFAVNTSSWRFPTSWSRRRDARRPPRRPPTARREKPPAPTGPVPSAWPTAPAAEPCEDSGLCCPPTAQPAAQPCRRIARRDVATEPPANHLPQCLPTHWPPEGRRLLLPCPRRSNSPPSRPPQIRPPQIRPPQIHPPPRLPPAANLHSPQICLLQVQPATHTPSQAQRGARALRALNAERSQLSIPFSYPLHKMLSNTRGAFNSGIYANRRVLASLALTAMAIEPWSRSLLLTLSGRKRPTGC